MQEAENLAAIVADAEAEIERSQDAFRAKYDEGLYAVRKAIAAGTITADEVANAEIDDLAIERGIRIDMQGTRGNGRIILDGNDISNVVAGGSLEFHVGYAPLVTLDFAAFNSAQAAASDFRLEVDAVTRKALIAIGWAPPKVFASVNSEVEELSRQLAHAERTLNRAFEAGDDAFKVAGAYRRIA